MVSKVFRVTVEKYPTPDGEPFIDQPIEFWQDIVERHEAKEEGNPAWLPDLTDWTCQNVHMEGYQYPNERGAFIEIDEEGYPLIVVPAIKRRHFFSRTAAQVRVNQFLAWGCDARVESAEIGDWQ